MLYDNPMDDFIEMTMQNLQKWEGQTDFFYLDNRRVNGVPSPLVTIGIGCAIGLTEAQSLPFQFNGAPASIAQISIDYTNIKEAPFDFPASTYAKYTEVRLPQGAIDFLCESLLATFVAALNETFPLFSSWPKTCKSAALDLMYGLGVTGFKKYKIFIAAGLQNPPNFREMAAQCASNANIAAYDKRNQARKLLFLQAVNL